MLLLAADIPKPTHLGSPQHCPCNGRVSVLPEPGKDDKSQFSRVYLLCWKSAIDTMHFKRKYHSVGGPGHPVTLSLTVRSSVWCKLKIIFVQHSGWHFFSCGEQWRILSLPGSLSTQIGGVSIVWALIFLQSTTSPMATSTKQSITGNSCAYRGQKEQNPESPTIIWLLTSEGKKGLSA